MKRFFVTDEQLLECAIEDIEALYERGGKTLEQILLSILERLIVKETTELDKAQLMAVKKLSE